MNDSPNELAVLRRLLAPVEIETFFATHWERTPLVVARNAPRHFDELLTIADVDAVITTRPLSAGPIQVTNAARETTNEDFTFEGGMVDTARLLKLFADGSTIIMNQLDRELPQLREFTRALERALSTRMQANVYLTPAHAQGFKPHYDSHDVFVLQVYGSKKWVIYDTPVELPMRGQAFDPASVKPGAPTMEFELHQGDTLYVPRGVMHDARTAGTDSLHITAGVMATPWTEWVLEAVAREALRDPAFRKMVPVGFARQGFDRTATRAHLRELLRRVADRVDPDVVIDHFAGDLISTRGALLEGQLTQILGLGALAIDSRVGARPNLMYQLRETAEHVVVSCYGSDFRMPAFAAPAVRFAIETPAYAVRELPGELDDAGKLVLVRRLIREGFVRAI